MSSRVGSDCYTIWSAEMYFYFYSNFSFWQEIYFLYNNLNPVIDTLGMKLHPVILGFFLFVEIVCYISLYHYLYNHDKSMANQQIISQDVYKSRTRVHFISLYAQVLGFFTEIVYFLIAAIVKFVGQKLSIRNILDYSNSLKMVEYFVTSTINIFATPDLRKALLSIFKRDWPF